MIYLPEGERDISNFVRKRCRCIADKRPNVPERAKLSPIESSYPFEVVAIDFIHLDRCKGGYEYVLVVTDFFTKFVQMYATKSRSSKAAAKKIFDEFILGYGFPKRIMHDKGGEWNSVLFEELHRLTGIEASNTTPYHPMSNGQCERMNRSLVSMLKSLSAKEKKNWASALPKLSFAYNSTHHSSTGFTPFYMTFGRESRLPIDGVFEEVQVDRNGSLKSRSYRDFVDQWNNSMAEAFKLAKERNHKSQEYNKEMYDKKVKEVGIEVGDQVLVKNLREKGGTGKLRSHWERQIFTVVKQKEHLPVYHVQNLKNSRDVRILHRNHLMKCEQLPTDVFDDDEEEEESPVKRITRSQTKLKGKSRTEGKGKKEAGKKVTFREESKEEDEASSEDEGEGMLVLYPSSVLQQTSHGVGSPDMTAPPEVELLASDEEMRQEDTTDQEQSLNQDANYAEEPPVSSVELPSIPEVSEDTDEELDDYLEEEPPLFAEDVPDTRMSEDAREDPHSPVPVPPDTEETLLEVQEQEDVEVEANEDVEEEREDTQNDNTTEDTTVRRSNRTPIPRAVFTIEKLGGNPSCSASTG